MTRQATPAPMGNTGDVAPATLYLHCQQVYEKMLSQAKKVEVLEPGQEIDDEPSGSMIVWEGMLTRLITVEMNLSIPYYTYVTKALKQMGCIKQLRRGGGTSPSQWELIKAPTEETFVNQTPKRSIRKTKTDMMQDQIMSLNNRVLTLERALEGFASHD